jgi:D-3-phosphoglycerate dehydrogenase
MLSLARSVPRFNASIHAGRWEKSGATGVELRGKTLGLLGLGRVGSEVARRARAFEMRVIAHDPQISADIAREAGAILVPLAELLAQSDFLSLHAALSSSTEKIINADSLSRMKQGAFLINAARGELIDETALADALRSGHLAGAALDVFAVEPPKNSPLLGLANVIATPHIAGSTREAQEEVGTLIAQQVRDYLAEGVLRNAVNLPALSPEQYRRARPYFELAERLGSVAAQIAAGRGATIERVRIAYAGETAGLGAGLLRSAVLAGILNTILDEPVNLVNAPSIAAERGLAIEERTRRREHGFPDTLEVATGSAGAAGEVAVEGTVLHGAEPRVLSIDGIGLEAPLEGTLLFTRNRDVPGVVGQIGTVLGQLGVNIGTFSLGRRAAASGADAVALVRLDGEVSDQILPPLRAISAITEARLLRLP